MAEVMADTISVPVEDYTFPNGVFVRHWPTISYTVTFFADETSVPAVSHDTDEYRARANALGYGSDVGRMSFEHEMLHSLRAMWLGLECSPVLWDVAHGKCAQDTHATEEADVLHLQACLNGVEAPRDRQEAAWIEEARKVLRTNADES